MGVGEERKVNSLRNNSNLFEDKQEALQRHAFRYETVCVQRSRDQGTI